MFACPLSSCPESYLYNNPNSCAGPLEIAGYEDGYSPEEVCILQRLAEGTPGRITLLEDCEGLQSHRNIFVLGPGVAMLTSSEARPCASCACGTETEWGTLDRCTLISAESFEGCLDATDRKAQLGCLVVENWFIDCAASEPVCTPE